jgi:Ca2+-binding RTX toxin-like protein
MADINGTEGDDYLDGGSGPDRIRGGRGKDVIFGWDGDDELFGDEEDDYLVGGIGNDRLYGGDGADELSGLDGDDVLRGEAGADELSGGSGSDDIEGGDGDDQIEGDSFASSIYGDGDDRIDGGQGKDDIHGGGGNDVLLGGTENDYLRGGAGEDYLDAGAGDDYLSGFGEESYGFDQHRDTLLAGEGNDNITVGYGDTVDGGSGVDTIYLFMYGWAAGGVTADLRNLAGNGTITIGGATITGIEYVSGISLTQYDDKVIAGLIPSGLDGIRMDGWGGNDELTGTAAVDNISGGDGDDIIWGGGGLNPAYYPSGDRLRGDAGNDVIHIGQDDAEATGGDGNDVIYGGAGTDSIYGENGSDRLSGADGNDGILGGWGADTIDGGKGSDFLDGGDGDDRLDGGTGADSMDGGEGFDIFVVDDAGDQVRDGEGLGLVETSLASYVLPLYLDNLTGTNSGPGGGQTLRGNFLANRILGSAGNDVISGLEGDDLLAGGAGDDFLTGGSGRDLLVGGALSGTELIANGSFETQDGNNSSEAFIRASGTYENGFASRKTQTLFGWQSATASPIELAIENYNTAFAAGDGAAAIDMESGTGENQSLFQDISGIPQGTLLVLNFTAAKAITSWFSTTSSATAVMEVLWNGVVVATITPQTIYMQQYSLVVAAAASGTGAGGANRLEFRELGAGSDGRGTMLDSVSLRAVADGTADVPNGGDTADYSQETGTGNVLVNLQSVAVSDPSGQMLGAREARDSHGALDSLWGIENVKTGAGDDRVYGDERANRIETGAGSDSLIGGAGNDMLIAGAGADFVDGGDGSDTVDGGEGDDTLQGGAGYDVLIGGPGNDWIDGGAGDDMMTGGTGDDVYVVDSAGDSVVETSGEGTDEVRTALAVYSLDALPNVENLSAIYGVDHDLRGNASNNVVTGLGGSDVIRLQGGGDDSAVGGGGNDQIFYGAAFTAADSTDGGAGTDVLVLQGDYVVTLAAGSLTNVEYLSLQSGSSTRYEKNLPLASHDYNITFVDANVAAGERFIVNASQLLAGEDFTFNGGAESNGSFLVYGGFGADVLTGGAGHDVFHFEGSRWGSGDSVNGGAGADSMVIRAGSGVHHIEFSETQLTSVESISVSDRFGLGQASLPSYEMVLANGNVAAGATLIVNGSTMLDPGQFIDVDGSAVRDGHLKLYGGAGGDTLIGGAGDDLIFAAGGADRMTGGEGQDTFQFRSLSDSTASAPDEILDFVSGVDKIDLGFIDANSNAAGNQAFTFVGTAFSGAAGELRAYQDSESGAWYVEGDVDGDGNADLVIVVTVQHPNPLVATDFML